MRTSDKHIDPANALGIFVELEHSADEKYRYRLESIAPYRARLIIALPSSPVSHRPTAVLQILRQVQCGGCWPVRFSYPNLTEFLSMEELQKIENCMPSVTVYVYNMPPVQRVSSFSEETLKRWHYAAYRASCAERKAANAELEGQIALEAV